MILNFLDRATEELFNGSDTKTARALPRSIWKVAQRKLDILNAAHEVQDLKAPPGNRLEMLKGDWKGWYSIRINDQFRIVFQWSDGNAKHVEIVDYH